MMFDKFAYPEKESQKTSCKIQLENESNSSIENPTLFS